MVKFITGFEQDGGFITIAIFVMLGIILSNITSNTAAVAILIPLVINVVKFLALDPLPYIYISTVAANCAYLLPTSVRAIPVGYGLNPQTMFLRGIWAIIISFIVVTIIGFLLINYWSYFAIA